jgi:hypothetical protein
MVANAVVSYFRVYYYIIHRCGYAVLLLISIVQKTVPCGRIKDCVLPFMCRPAAS